MTPVNFLTLLGYIDGLGVPIYDLDTEVECNFSENPLGAGRTMKVYKAYLKKDDKKIKLAAKVTNQRLLLHTPDYKIYEILDSLRQDIRIMQHLADHPNIIDFYGMSFNELKPIIFVEFSIGSLQHYLEDMKEEDNPVNWATKAAFCCDVADGLHALHAVGVVHGDIKADNVLLFPISEDNEEQNLVAKIADFGYSATTASIDRGCGTRGTRNFHAPENTSGAPEKMQKFKDKPKKDNYSFGLFVWQVSKDGEIPYANLEDVDIEKIKHKDKHLNTILKLLPSDTPEEFLFVISKTTRYKPSDRASLFRARRILSKLLDGKAAMYREIQREAKEAFINNAIELPKLSKTEISSIKSMRIPLTIKKKIYSDFEKAARNKLAEAALSLSICYKEGFGVNIDIDKVVEWLIKAVEYGSLEAMTNLANEFYIKELPVDPNTAFLWYIKVAHGGSLIAQFKVSICYYIGIGVDKDIVKGDFWISKCGLVGLVSTLEAMGLYESDKGLLLDSALSFLLTVCDEIDATIGYKPGLLNEDIGNNQTNKMKALITGLGADVFTLREERPMSIRRASLKGYIGYIGMMRYSSIRDVDMKINYNGTFTPLHEAALNGYIGIAKLLDKLGMDVNTKDNGGSTPLHKAALNGHIDIAMSLTQLGANANSKDNGDSTPLHKATLNGHIDMVKLLVTELGADVNSKDSNGRTSIHEAALNRDINMAKLLAELGADVNSKDNKGSTLLHKATINRHIGMVKLLVTELGADVTSKDNKGWTPIHEAALNWDVDMAKLLVAELGTGVNIKKDKILTPLHGSLKWDINRIKDFINQLDKNVNIEDFISLFEYLKQCTDLNLGVFERHIIDFEWARFLANGLKLNIALTTLNLSHNMIGDLGARHLAEALKQNTTLTNLNLKENDISYNGAYFLAETLRLNTALTILNLGNNMIGDTGAYALVFALKQNTTLTNLDVRRNRINKKFFLTLLEIPTQNTGVLLLE